MALAITRICGWLAFLFTVMSLFADDQATHNTSFATKHEPWFTGPIVTPSGYTVKWGHGNIQPYLFVKVNTGSYSPEWKSIERPNFYSTTLRVLAKAALCRWIDFLCVPETSYNATEGAGDFVFNDLPVIFNFQLFRPEEDSPWPAMKLGLGTKIPSGKYQQLTASKLYTDVGGNGNWEPGPILSFTKLWNVSKAHFLEARLSTSYRFGVPVSVRGLNAYGGAHDTKGTVYPGNRFFIDGSIQYNFNQRWACACDLVYLHADRTTFSGIAGTLDDGTPANLSALSIEQFSLAPALEYNLNKNLGLLGGVWFSFAGRNATQFVNGVISFNAYL